ncbi:MAG: phage holin family protein [Gaiellaceae bacterium MAG52_C11]|nr:phage holin family protein [Candidatus Gaiellasilicea maunaloa]
MPTRAGSSSGVGGAAKQVAEHASSLAKLELELAGLELKRKVGALGAGLGLGVGAALVALFGLGFLLATFAAALALVLDTWLALLIVTLGLFAIAAVLGLLALSRIKKGTPPVPEQAIREAKLTTEALKANGSH